MKYKMLYNVMQCTTLLKLFKKLKYQQFFNNLIIVIYY